MNFVGCYIFRYSKYCRCHPSFFYLILPITSDKMKSVLIVYYTQTGQLKHIADTICEEFKGIADVDYYKIQPVHDFPFPWSSDEFFDTMPESVKGIPVELDLSDFPSDKQYDLVILAYQVWYLSPSIPFMSFLQSPKAKEFLKGKQIITLLGVRNMWVVAQEEVKKILVDAKAILAGNIVLTDHSGNMVSVITIIKWLIHGNKGPYRFLPDAGVSDKDIIQAVRFAAPVKQALSQEEFSNLQNELLLLKAVEMNYHTMRIEKTAIRIFNVFASFILRKGPAKSKSRLFRVRIFKYYLLFAIFVMFPVAALVFNLRKLIMPARAAKEMKYHQGVDYHS